MYWYKKISDDTGNPELIEKQNESSDKKANDFPKKVADKVKEEVKAEGEKYDAKNDDKLQHSAGPTSNEPTSIKEEARPEKKTKIIEPVEEFKMKKELNDLQFTYVLCSQCFTSGKYPSSLTPVNFEKCSIQALLVKTGLLKDEKDLLTPQEVEKLVPEGEWNEQETLQLLDAIAEHGEDWGKVAEVFKNKKSKDQCINHFICLPINENTSEKIHNINA
jgi:hypothetical protein